jgi:hypothetical protein
MPEGKPAPTPGVDVADLVQRVLKYALEGLAVAVAAYLLPGKTLRLSEIGQIGLVALAHVRHSGYLCAQRGRLCPHGCRFRYWRRSSWFPRLKSSGQVIHNSLHLCS